MSVPVVCGLVLGSAALVVAVMPAVARAFAALRAPFARALARHACADRIPGCTRTDRHYHPGSGVAP